jgi:PBP1b-binding outer membrane lipoprotein LpoB
MKKVFLFFVLALTFAACTPKKAEQAPAKDTTAVKVDTAKVDTAKVDTTKAVK